LDAREHLKRDVIADASKYLELERVRDATADPGRLLLHPELSIAIELWKRDLLMVQGEMDKTCRRWNANLFREFRPPEMSCKGMSARRKVHVRNVFFLHNGEGTSAFDDVLRPRVAIAGKGNQ
jgi:hypothetical protein